MAKRTTKFFTACRLKGFAFTTLAAAVGTGLAGLALYYGRKADVKAAELASKGFDTGL